MGSVGFPYKKHRNEHGSMVPSMSGRLRLRFAHSSPGVATHVCLCREKINLKVYFLRHSGGVLYVCTLGCRALLSRLSRRVDTTRPISGNFGRI